jgi:hypothetical protein
MVPFYFLASFLFGPLLKATHCTSFTGGFAADSGYGCPAATGAVVSLSAVVTQPPPIAL